METLKPKSRAIAYLEREEIKYSILGGGKSYSLIIELEPKGFKVFVVDVDSVYTIGKIFNSHTTWAMYLKANRQKWRNL